jgi:hypothetical protein
MRVDVRLDKSVIVLDLTESYDPSEGHNPETEGVWSWAFLNAPKTLTFESKKKIFDNILNNRSPFKGCGRIPEQAIYEYLTRSN